LADSYEGIISTGFQLRVPVGIPLFFQSPALFFLVFFWALPVSLRGPARCEEDQPKCGNTGKVKNINPETWEPNCCPKGWLTYLIFHEQSGFRASVFTNESSSAEDKDSGSGVFGAEGVEDSAKTSISGAGV
jgi:hypothetical protein